MFIKHLEKKWQEKIAGEPRGQKQQWDLQRRNSQHPMQTAALRYGDIHGQRSRLGSAWVLCFFWGIPSGKLT